MTDNKPKPVPHAAPGRHTDYWDAVFDAGRYSLYKQGWKHVLNFSEPESGAGVLAIDSEDRVCLIECYRYTVDRILYEIPRGMAEPDESMAECGAREFEEETGIPLPVSDLVYLGQFSPDNGILGTRPHLFGIRLPYPFPEPMPDHSEALGVVFMKRADFHAACATGQVDCPFAVVAAQRFEMIEKNVSFSHAVGRVVQTKPIEILDTEERVLASYPSWQPERDFQGYRLEHPEAASWRFAAAAFRQGA